MLEQASHGVSVIEVAGSWNTNLFSLKQISFALEKALQTEIVERLSCGIVE